MVMAYTVMAYICIAYIVMAYVFMAYMVMVAEAAAVGLDPWAWAECISVRVDTCLDMSPGMCTSRLQLRRS